MSAVLTQPRQTTVSRAEFYRMADAGVFRNRRVERIGGELVVMSPQNWRHAVTTDAAGEAIRHALGDGFWVRTQLPMEFGLEHDPEPEVSVVIGQRSDYSGHPQAALLVVEVSESSLAYDRGEKANLYAAAGILDYWVVDLVNRQVEVFREPRPEPTVRFGANYTKVAAFLPGQEIVPLAMPTARVPVADLLP